MQCKWINGKAKREEVVAVFKKGKFEFLALTETKLKGKRDVSGCEVNAIIVGVQKTKGSGEGVPVSMNDVWYSAVIDFGYVSSRTMG